jgi:glycosyltransferase involved in cell wall biosynthesis
MDIMRAAAQGAAVVVAFSSDMRDVAADLFGLDPSAVRVVPQSVQHVPPNPEFVLVHLAVWGGAPMPKQIYLLPAGLRPVKDVLFLASAFEKWHAEDPDVVLLIVGHGADEEYAQRVRTAAKTNAGVYVGPALPQDCLFRSFAQCAAVVNTSVSEGMCGVLVEAMLYGCPVLARRNSGNTAVIAHEVGHRKTCIIGSVCVGGGGGRFI